MSHDRSHLRIVDPDDPFTSAPIIPILPPGREIEILTDISHDWLDAFFDALEGHRCPECACEIEHVMQVGPAINALPCGHRLGTGWVRAVAGYFGYAVAEG
jgi:hypothetical protein